MALAHSPRIVMDGLVLCLDAANFKSYPRSGITLSDLSGYGHTGTLINGTTYSDNGLNFDGVDDGVTIAETSAMRPQILTYDIWLKINSDTNSAYGGAPNTYQYPLFRQNSRTTNYAGYMLEYNETTRLFRSLVNNSTGGEYSTSASITTGLGVIRHISSVIDTTLISIYQDGVFQNSAGKASGINYNSNHSLTIGRANPTGVSWDVPSNCSIYSVKIYNRALSAFEIQQNFNALRGRFGI